MQKSSIQPYTLVQVVFCNRQPWPASGAMTVATEEAMSDCVLKEMPEAIVLCLLGSWGQHSS